MTDKRIFEGTPAETQALPALASYADLDRHVAHGRQLRAEATAQMLASGTRATSSLLRGLITALARRHRQRQGREALMRCSDRVLADVGIARQDIPLIAKGIDPKTVAPREPGLSGWWRALAVRMQEARRARQDRQRVEGELMAYSDRDLDEIGIRRADIRTIARGRLPEPANSRRAA